MKSAENRPCKVCSEQFSYWRLVLWVCLVLVAIGLATILKIWIVLSVLPITLLALIRMWDSFCIDEGNAIFQRSFGFWAKAISLDVLDFVVVGKSKKGEWQIFLGGEMLENLIELNPLRKPEQAVRLLASKGLLVNFDPKAFDFFILRDQMQDAFDLQRTENFYFLVPKLNS